MVIEREYPYVKPPNISTILIMKTYKATMAKNDPRLVILNRLIQMIEGWEFKKNRSVIIEQDEITKDPEEITGS